ncbi:10465_t:CDS:2, partial [Acaulospora morrowiae]
SPELIEEITTGHPSEDLEECLDNNGTLKIKNDKSNNSKEKDNAGECFEENDQPLQIIETKEKDILSRETTLRTMNQTLEILGRR